MAAPWTGQATARIIGKVQGQDCINVLHFATNTQVNDPIDWEPLLTALAAAVLACAVEQLLPATTIDYTLDRVEVARYAPDKSNPIVATAPAQSHGEFSSASVSFASSLVKMVSTRGGRRGHGRIFLPPPGEAETLNSQMNSDVQTALQQFIDCLIGKFVGAGATEQWRLGVFSVKQFKEAVGGGFDNAFAEVTAMSINTDLAIMGSRKKGRGN